MWQQRIPLAPPLLSSVERADLAVLAVGLGGLAPLRGLLRRLAAFLLKVKVRVEGPTGLSCRLAGCQATPVGAIRTKLRLAAVGFIATIREDDDVLLTDTPTCENPA